MSPKKIILLGSTLMFLALGAGLKASPIQWVTCGESGTRMGAFLPMIPTTTPHHGSGDFVTVYDCD